MSEIHAKIEIKVTIELTYPELCALKRVSEYAEKDIRDVFLSLSNNEMKATEFARFFHSNRANFNKALADVQKLYTSLRETNINALPQLNSNIH